MATIQCGGYDAYNITRAGRTIVVVCVCAGARARVCLCVWWREMQKTRRPFKTNEYFEPKN